MTRKNTPQIHRPTAPWWELALVEFGKDLRLGGCNAFRSDSATLLDTGYVQEQQKVLEYITQLVPRSREYDTAPCPVDKLSYAVRDKKELDLRFKRYQAYLSKHFEILEVLQKDTTTPLLKAVLSEFIWSYKGSNGVPVSVGRDAVLAYLQVADELRTLENRHVEVVTYLSHGLRLAEADPMVKWIVPSMASVIQEAVRRIKAVTAEPRRVAQWYSENPQKLYLPAHLEHLRTRETLDMYELSEVLFSEELSNPPVICGLWCRSNGVTLTQLPAAKKVKGLTKTALFSDVERAVLAKLPSKFPFLDQTRGLLLKDSLFLVAGNAMHATRATYQCLVEPYAYSSLYARIGGSESMPSLFQELGYAEDDGSPIHLRTHQIRHYLNTLANRGGLSEVDIARWAGRANIHQNSAYDHESAADLAEQARRVVSVPDGLETGVLAANSPRPITLVKRQDFRVPEGGHCAYN